MAHVTAVAGELNLATWTPRNAGAPIPELITGYGACLDSLVAEGAVILHERAFGGLDLAPAVLAAREALGRTRALDAPPLNYIDGSPTAPGSFTGIHVLAARPSVQSAQSSAAVVSSVAS